MPLIHRYIHKTSEVIIWKIVEPHKYFTSKMTIDLNTLPKSITKKRLLEWLMPRFILENFLRTKSSLYLKDSFGKPYIKNDPRYISITHSSDHFAFLISNTNCGIDLQCFNDKIKLVSKKFVSSIETEWLKTSNDKVLSLHLIWSAKEAIYKAYGRKKISFRANIEILNTIHSAHSLSILRYNNKVSYFNTYNLSNQVYSLIYATETN